MSVDARHHRHFVTRKADILRQITDECGGVLITFPKMGSKSDKVVLKGAKQCVDAARQRILDIVTELVSTAMLILQKVSRNYYWTLPSILYYYT